MSYSDGKIEVGMMVEIVDDGTPGVSGYDRECIGRVGEVIGLYETHPDLGNRWEVSGADPEDRAWPESMLRPIQPPQELSSWEEVQKITKWSPQEKQHETM